MFVASMVWALLLPAIPADPSNDMFDAGVERGRHILVSVAGVPDRPGRAFSATLFAVPVNWPANHSTSEVWIAEFDCAARSRKMRVRLVYSGRRDPVRTTMEEAPAESGGAALEAQLDIVCGGRGRSSRPSYNDVGQFTRALCR